MYTLLKSKNEGLKDSAIEFTRGLVRTPSPSFQESAAAELVEKQMHVLGYDEVYHDDAGNVIGVMFGREASPTLLLASHLDAVDAKPEDWGKDSPYSGAYEHGRIFGVGASDCKAGVAAQIYAGALIKRCGLPLRGNLVVAATVAEANGRSIGMQTLLKRTMPNLELKADYAILGEPTGLNLYYGHDGWVEFDICVEGTNPFQVEDAAKAIYGSFRSESEGGHTGRPEWMEVDEPHMTDSETHLRATVPMARRLHEADSVEEIVGQIKGHAALAAQNAGAVAVDVLVREETKQLCTGRATIVRSVTNAWTTDPFHPLIERSRHALAAAGCATKCGKWQLDRLGMGTAGSMLTTKFEVPTVGYGPGLENQAHAAGEYVEAAKLVECVYGTAAIAYSLVGVPVFGWTSDEI